MFGVFQRGICGSSKERSYDLYVDASEAFIRAASPSLPEATSIIPPQAARSLLPVSEITTPHVSYKASARSDAALTVKSQTHVTELLEASQYPQS